jgi:hypothetical protein
MGLVIEVSVRDSPDRQVSYFRELKGVQTKPSYLEVAELSSSKFFLNLIFKFTATKINLK